MKKKFNSVFFLILTLVFIIIILGYFFEESYRDFELKNVENNLESSSVNLSSIELSQNEAVMIVGEVLQLEYLFTPSDASEISVSWNSSNNNVAIVEDGQVKAVGYGEVIIKAIASNGKFATCKIYVKPEIILETNNVSLMDEESVSIQVSLKGISMSDINWVINNNNIDLEVLENKLNIKAKEVGTTVVTGTFKSDESVEVTMTVKVREISILMIGNSKTFYEETGTKLKNISQSGGYTTVVKWFTREEGVGGKSLQYLYENKLTEISFVYDYVIMQENVPNMLLDYATFYSGAFNITKVVKEKNANVKVYLRQSYLREAQNVTTLSQYKATVAYENVNKIVNDEEINKISKIGLIRDGESMYVANDEYKLDVFADSTYHQTPIGAYLVANCVYATIFNENPIKNTYTDSDNGYSGNTASTIKTIASDYCYN